MVRDSISCNCCTCVAEGGGSIGVQGI
jgi:hypothetical protein